MNPVSRRSGACDIWRLIVFVLVIAGWEGEIRADNAAASAATQPSASEQPPRQPEPASPYLTGNWWRLRPKLADDGFTFDIGYTADGTKNLRGGIDTAGSTWRRVFELTATMDTKSLFGLEGGTILADFQNAQGPNSSDDLVGDVQGIDGLDGVPGMTHQNRTQLGQLWYQQTAFGDVLRVKIGKVDANTEFDRAGAGLEFLHQSYGSSATLFTLPTYPDPAMGINVFVKPVNDLQIGFGIYDGSYADGARTGDLGPRNFLRRGSDLFLIGEIDKSWMLGKTELPGRLGAGGWFNTNTFRRFDGGEADGTGGPFALAEQTVWKPAAKGDGDTRNITFFAMYGYADPAITSIDHNLGGGIVWNGPIANRPSDIAGFGVQAAHFSKSFVGGNQVEVSYETFYRLQMTPWLSIKPDVQYVSNPGGRGTPDALAITARFLVVF